MEFSSLLFLYVVLPMILLGYFLIPDVGRRNMFLIAVGMLLYSMVQPLYLLLMVLLSRFTFTMAKKMKHDKPASLFLPVLVNLIPLLLLKYLDPVLLSAGIGAKEGGILLGLIGKAVDAINGTGLKLHAPVSLTPLGCSFYVLGAISYLTDVYRGKFPAEKSYKSFLLYVFFIPKLFQGPVVRYDQMRLQLRERKENYRAVFEGALRFFTGLGKKVLLADACARMINEMAASGSNLALVGSWLTAELFLFRVYYDFSGCCDMAVGLGRIFGFRLPENFNLPFMALSVTEFFERWNLTLRSFVKDYIHDPLRGKREGGIHGFVVLLMSVLLGALWHGGNFTFLVWGLYILALIMAEKFFDDFLTSLPYWLRHVLTILALMFAFVIFAHPDVETLVVTLKAMIGDGGLNVTGDGARVWNSLPLIAVCWLGVTSLPRQLRYRIRIACDLSGKHIPAGRLTVERGVYLAGCLVYMLAILWYVTVSGIGSPVQPSIFMYL